MWNLDSVTETSITQSWRTPYLSGYPFDLRVRAAYTADAEGLHVTVTAHNADTKNAPWACAMHPWLANGSDAHGDAIDAANAQCRLAIPADTHEISRPWKGGLFMMRGRMSGIIRMGWPLQYSPVRMALQLS